ncbi:hypothetical protein CXG81DRAFT_21296 [Caulochytrium protostelioides]|uniref:F-box domain-containing protein n=1 Tax=Caulochytrium protostelioides TaxID=1555241 RepID=A0A4P9X295_9FUNG|nr:hypothetical protein CXG81DRAFT_21296 [Caulochytrium protostelioides]|eukprot:RKO98480.1 hypothetical protein CXG81DRAFT_21296 [Caulochytrium protostelioides]
MSADQLPPQRRRRLNSDAGEPSGAVGIYNSDHNPAHQEYYSAPSADLKGKQPLHSSSVPSSSASAPPLSSGTTPGPLHSETDAELPSVKPSRRTRRVLPTLPADVLRQIFEYNATLPWELHPDNARFNHPVVRQRLFLFATVCKQWAAIAIPLLWQRIYLLFIATANPPVEDLAWTRRTVELLEASMRNETAYEYIDFVSRINVRLRISPDKEGPSDDESGAEAAAMITSAVDATPSLSHSDDLTSRPGSPQPGSPRSGSHRPGRMGNTRDRGMTIVSAARGSRDGSASAGSAARPIADSQADLDEPDGNGGGDFGHPSQDSVSCDEVLDLMTRAARVLSTVSYSIVEVQIIDLFLDRIEEPTPLSHSCRLLIQSIQKMRRAAITLEAQNLGDSELNFVMEHCAGRVRGLELIASESPPRLSTETVLKWVGRTAANLEVLHLNLEIPGWDGPTLAQAFWENPATKLSDLALQGASQSMIPAEPNEYNFSPNAVRNLRRADFYCHPDHFMPNERWIELVAIGAENIQYLLLWQPPFTATTVASVNWPKLLYLTVSGQPDLAPSFISAVARSCRHLGSLTLISSCEGFNDDTMHELSVGCPFLEELRISHRAKVTHKSLRSLQRLSTLKVLQCASDVFAPNHFGMLLALAHACRQLGWVRIHDIRSCPELLKLRCWLLPRETMSLLWRTGIPIRTFHLWADILSRAFPQLVDPNSTIGGLENLTWEYHALPIFRMWRLEPFFTPSSITGPHGHGHRGHDGFHDTSSTSYFSGSSAISELADDDAMTVISQGHTAVDDVAIISPHHAAVHPNAGPTNGMPSSLAPWHRSSATHATNSDPNAALGIVMPASLPLRPVSQGRSVGSVYVPANLPAMRSSQAPAITVSVPAHPPYLPHTYQHSVPLVMGDYPMTLDVSGNTPVAASWTVSAPLTSPSAGPSIPQFPDPTHHTGGYAGYGYQPITHPNYPLRAPEAASDGDVPMVPMQQQQQQQQQQVEQQQQQQQQHAPRLPRLPGSVLRAILEYETPIRDQAVVAASDHHYHGRSPLSTGNAPDDLSSPRTVGFASSNPMSVPSPASNTCWPIPPRYRRHDLLFWLHLNSQFFQWIVPELWRVTEWVFQPDKAHSRTLKMMDALVQSTWRQKLRASAASSTSPTSHYLDDEDDFSRVMEGAGSFGSSYAASHRTSSQGSGSVSGSFFASPPCKGAYAEQAAASASSGQMMGSSRSASSAETAKRVSAEMGTSSNGTDTRPLAMLPMFPHTQMKVVTLRLVGCAPWLDPALANPSSMAAMTSRMPQPSIFDMTILPAVTLLERLTEQLPYLAHVDHCYLDDFLVVPPFPHLYEPLPGVAADPAVNAILATRRANHIKLYATTQHLLHNLVQGHPSRRFVIRLSQPMTNVTDLTLRGMLPLHSVRGLDLTLPASLNTELARIMTQGGLSNKLEHLTLRVTDMNAALLGAIERCTQLRVLELHLYRSPHRPPSSTLSVGSGSNTSSMAHGDANLGGVDRSDMRPPCLSASASSSISSVALALALNPITAAVPAHNRLFTTWRTARPYLHTVRVHYPASDAPGLVSPLTGQIIMPQCEQALERLLTLTPNLRELLLTSPPFTGAELVLHLPDWPVIGASAVRMRERDLECSINLSATGDAPPLDDDDAATMPSSAAELAEYRDAQVALSHAQLELAALRAQLASSGRALSSLRVVTDAIAPLHTFRELREWARACPSLKWVQILPMTYMPVPDADDGERSVVMQGRSDNSQSFQASGTRDSPNAPGDVPEPAARVKPPRRPQLHPTVSAPRPHPVSLAKRPAGGWISAQVLRHTMST